MKWDYYRFLSRLGPVALSQGMPYARCVEYPEVVRRLRLASDDRVLDIGSRYSPFPALLAMRHGCSVTAVDPEPNFEKKQMAMMRKVPHALKLAHEGKLSFHTRDAGELPFPDGHFTKIAAISVLEHIVDEGPVMRELARLLAKNGLLAISVPYDPYRDEPKYYRRKVYVTGQHESEEFYQRYYNDDNLRSRLVEPSGLRLLSTDYFGEPGFNAHNLLYGNQRIPWYVRRVLFQPLAPFLAPLLIRKLEPRQFRHKTKMYTCDIAILILTK
ncbi:MAG: class I SAM-dependent methyltransferase [Candidatus Eisenbacteria bacterium]|nr:class I SAM-dependent methyltransferase [Candidatus Eisenbacteria bacterium]